MPCLQGGKTQRSFSGSGADEDIVVSSARAYVRWVLAPRSSLPGQFVCACFAMRALVYSLILSMHTA